MVISKYRYHSFIFYISGGHVVVLIARPLDFKKSNIMMGCGEVANTGDFDSSIRWFKSSQPSNSLLCAMLCGNGGTGRRPRLKIWYLMMCEFKPHFPHIRRVSGWSRKRS